MRLADPVGGHDMLIDKARIGQLIPHAGTMCLLDRVTTWDAETIQCVAISHLDARNPLRRGGRLSAICGVEYAAQAMAVHGALKSDAVDVGRAGYLASLRDVACCSSDIDTAGRELEVEAKLLIAESNRVIYAFRVRCAGQTLVSGRAAVVLGAKST